MRKGIQSSEFWINLIGIIGGLVLASAGDSTWTQLIGGTLAAVCGSSYTIGRSMVKGSEATGASRVEAAALLTKKSKDS